MNKIKKFELYKRYEFGYEVSKPYAVSFLFYFYSEDENKYYINHNSVDRAMIYPGTDSGFWCWGGKQIQ